MSYILQGLKMDGMFFSPKVYAIFIPMTYMNNVSWFPILKVLYTDLCLMVGNQQQVSLTHAEKGRSTISFPKKTAQVKEDHMVFSFN